MKRSGVRVSLRPLLSSLLVLLLAAGSGACSSGEVQILNLTGTQDLRVYPVTGVNTNFFLAPERLDNEDVWAAVEEARISAMRFPGGRGNLYDWQTGVIDEREEATGRDASNVVPMDEFMSRARDAGVEVSYVLNITDSPGSIRRLARHWERTNAPVRWVEMGNEYYLPALVDDVAGPRGYMRRARQALEALRDGGYQGPVGLVAAPEEVPGRQDPRGNLRSWNEEIAASDTSGFDAVILHYYPTAEEGDAASVYESGPSDLAGATEILQDRFPDKQVWVTEWNLGDLSSAPEFNSLGHALFDLRMMKALIEARVTLADYHVLTGRGWELLGPDRFVLNHDDGNVQLLRRVPYFAFEMTNRAMEGRTEYLAGGESPDGVEFMAFRTREELRVVAWSFGEASRNLEVRMDQASLRFDRGEALRGKLTDTNGSLLGMRGTDRVWNEEVKLSPIQSPRLEGPGAVLLYYSLEG